MSIYGNVYGGVYGNAYGAVAVLGVREQPGRQTEGDGLNTSHTRTYTAIGYATESDAEAAIALAAPSNVTRFSVPLTRRRYTMVEREASRNGLFDYTFEVKWIHVSKSREEQDNTETETVTGGIDFNFTGGNTFFTRAISQDDFGPITYDFGESIGVDENGEVNGIEVPIPSSGFIIPDTGRTFATDTEFNNWLKGVIGQIWTTNSNTWRSLEPGDAFLRGVSGRQVSSTDLVFDIQYDIAVQIGETNPTVEGISISRRVKGFEAIWVYYESLVDETAKLIKPNALAAFVSQVFKESNFTF